MLLEQQVVSLELAKRLKALNVKQESLFIWYGIPHDVGDKVGTIKLRWKVRKAVNDHNPAKYSAFTVAELGEMLPLFLKEDSAKGIAFSVETCGLQIYKNYNDSGWVVRYRHRHESADTLADALAKMLIHLLENSLIPLPING